MWRFELQQIRTLLPEIAPLQDIIEVSVPTIDLSATTGADGSTMYYADESMFIFGGYYGLFVYDVTKSPNHSKC